MGKRELVVLLNLSSWCLVMVERLFLAVPQGCLRLVIVVFPDHTHLLFLFLVFWRNYWFPILFGYQVSLMKRAGGFCNCKWWHTGVFFCVSWSQCLALVCDMWLWHSLVIHTYCWGLAICLFLELYLKPKVTLHFEQPNISLLFFFILNKLNIAMSCWYPTKQNSRKTTSVKSSSSELSVLSLKAQIQHPLAKANVNLGFEPLCFKGHRLPSKYTSGNFVSDG